VDVGSWLAGKRVDIVVVEIVEAIASLVWKAGTGWARWVAGVHVDAVFVEWAVCDCAVDV